VSQITNAAATRARTVEPRSLCRFGIANSGYELMTAHVMAALAVTVIATHSVAAGAPARLRVGS